MENRELPTNVLLGSISEEEQCSGAGEQTLDGSQSKIKDLKSLEQAYLNLQSEFTRKCQKLSELEKCKNDNLIMDNSRVKPFYEEENWQENVSQFLLANPDAKEFASEIVNEIIKDKDLASSPNSLQLAYNKILASKYIPTNKLIESEDFINTYILTNEKIKEKIINNYIKGLNNQTPKVIASSKLSSVGLTPNKKASNLEEARKMVTDLFK